MHAPILVKLNFSKFLPNLVGMGPGLMTWSSSRVTLGHPWVTSTWVVGKQGSFGPSMDSTQSHALRMQITNITTHHTQLPAQAWLPLADLTYFGHTNLQSANILCLFVTPHPSLCFVFHTSSPFWSTNKRSSNFHRKKFGFSQILVFFEVNCDFVYNNKQLWLRKWSLFHRVVCMAAIGVKRSFNCTE